MKHFLAMWKRLVTLIKGWLGIGVETEEMLLEQVRRERMKVHARNRTRAVESIMRRNDLQQMVDDLQKKIDSLQAEAELASSRGDHDRHAAILKEKQGYEVSLAAMHRVLEKAAGEVEAIKQRIQREQDEIRKRRK
jgi:phage shock protein A